MEVISTESTSTSSNPCIASDSNDSLYIVWQDSTDYNGAGIDSDIFYKKWDALTESWTTTGIISTESTSTSNFPSLVIDKRDNIHVAWEDDTAYGIASGSWSIFYKNWNSTALTWSITEVVSTESTKTSLDPFIDVDSQGYVHIAWEDYTDYAGAGSDRDVFYKYRDVKSKIWENTYVISTIETDIDFHPVVRVDTKGHVHFVWQNFDDIFYRKFIPAPEAPVLSSILPDLSTTGDITLDWSSIPEATSYYIYKNQSYIWSVEDLSPIASTSDTKYVDTVTVNGLYYYAIVARNINVNSSLSNVEHVEVEIYNTKLFSSLGVSEFFVGIAILAGIQIILFVVDILFIRKRRKIV